MTVLSMLFVLACLGALMFNRHLRDKVLDDVAYVVAAREGRKLRRTIAQVEAKRRTETLKWDADDMKWTPADDERWEDYGQAGPQ